MRLLLDINIILDVIFERPGAMSSSEVIARFGIDFQAYLAWHSIATLAYLIERQQNQAAARAVITDLLGWAQIVSTGHADALQALKLEMPDFEDALQASAAVACGANFIITRNVRDFKNSPVLALTPEAFHARMTSKK